MATSNFSTIQDAIDRRSRRFLDTATLERIHTGHLMADLVDETGTIDMVQMDGEELFLQSQFTAKELEEVRQVDDYLLQVHGTAPEPKREGILRLLYENVNGLNNRLCGNDKLERGREMIDELGIDIAAFNELRTNFAHKKVLNGLTQLFDGGEAEIRARNGYNVHENISKYQEGGTGIITFGTLTEQFDHLNSGTDNTGLGRFTFTRYVGAEGIATWVVCGYQPCISKGVSTSFQQQRRYFISKGRPDTNPREKFVEDLLALLTTWREAGDRIIVCLDANENIYQQRIGKALTDFNGLAMKEVVGEFTGRQLGPTYFRGSQPIDGVWATRDIEVKQACVMPVGYGMGDHRVFVIDFTISSLIGTTPTRVKRLKSRRLNTQIPGAAEKYNTILENLLRQHNVDKHHRAAFHASSTQEAAVELSASDRKSRQFMAHAEKKCRKIKSGRILFSPEAAVWIKRKNAYLTLLRFHAKRKVNRGNLKRTCRRLHIIGAFQLSVCEIKARLLACEAKCEHFRKHGKRYRKQHLQRRLNAAQKRGDETAEKRILAIIQGEKDRAFWRWLNYKLGKRRGGAVRSVQVETDEGDIEEYDDKEGMEQAVFNAIHGTPENGRFYMAGDAPICKGRLKEQFGYNADTEAANMVLDGTFEFSDDFPTATRQLLEQIAKIRSLVPEGSVSSIIDHEKFANSWRKTKERTSSSFSNLHFGHYIAGSRSEYISNYHAVKISLALMRGISLSRWQHGLSCILEKKEGSRLVTKLRSILLLEADMNKANKIIYGERMMDNIRKYHLMPEEIFSEKNRTADDGALSKILFFDIGRQLRAASAIASVDASNCYDRIAHAIASLVFQAFGVQQPAAVSMLTTIQEMRYFLRTAYGDSDTCAHSTVEVKYQGLCQGNGAAPAGWAAISITILMAHKANGHGATFVCPITPGKTVDLAAILFVDDTDIIHINMTRRETIQEVHSALSASVSSWNDLLLATGGTLHPDKCFYYLMSYKFDRRRQKWTYEEHTEDPSLFIEITLPNGTPCQITQYPITHAETMLGVKTSPSGLSTNACNCINAAGVKCQSCLEVLAEKASDCAQKVIGSNITRHQFWKWITACFWPKISYGLSCNTAPVSTLSQCLSKQYRQLLPRGGIIRSAPKELRDLDIGFFGAGLPNLPIECAIQQVNKLLMHCGSSSSVGVELQCSLELFLIELGRSHQPFSVSFESYNSFVTDSWIKSIWEKARYFGFDVIINNVDLPYPRERDQWIMVAFEECGFSQKELASLNRVRLRQQVLFLSDVLCVQGKQIDPKYKTLRREEDTWSNLRFPHEEPSQSDLKLWKRALAQVAPRWSLTRGIGRWVRVGHKLQDWRYCENTNTIFRYHGDNLMDLYPPAVVPPYNSPRRYSRYGRDRPRESCDVACTIAEVAPAIYRIIHTEVMPASPMPPTTLFEVLEQWGRTWMWKDLELTGGYDWIIDAIAASSLMCVSDGSYIKEIYPDICSTAFIFECSEGRGRLLGKFPERIMSACAYRGELLGLLAIHLLLLALNKLSPDLLGRVNIFSDCLGALDNIKYLPSHRIPSGCKHSDILKIIMIHCRSLSFEIVLSHVSAHKLDRMRWDQLTRPEQLNEQCDQGAKMAILEADRQEMGRPRPLPLEAVTVYIGDEKMTTDTGDRLRFLGNLPIAEKHFARRKILLPGAFAQVDWTNVHVALHEVPRGFQLWACKQVNNLAATNARFHKLDSSHSPLCPSCLNEPETCAHVLMCEQEDRVKCFLRSVENLRTWLEAVGTNPWLTESICSFAQSRNSQSFGQCVECYHDNRMDRLARSQDKIGWRRFMEGMISKEFRNIQDVHSGLYGTIPGNKWAQGLVTKLLEITHGQWLVRNFLIHDEVSGMLALERKEDLQIAIEEQIEMGVRGLDEEDKYLMEIKLEDLETTRGESQAYWLLAAQSARKAHTLRRRQQPRRNSQTTTDRVG